MRQLVSCLLGVFLVFVTRAVISETFTVITDGDGPVSTCILNDCNTLRDALTEANQSPDADTIIFNIPGGGVKTITPLTLLPIITGPVTISGFSQPGAIQNTNDTLSGLNAQLMIELDGTLLNYGSDFGAGLEVRAGNSVIEGLVIKNYQSRGILLFGGGNNIIRGNFIGTNADGLTAAANGVGIGILDSSNNYIGEASNFNARNLISGNTFNGIEITGALSSGNKVEANLIGTDITGNAALGNGLRGILLTSLVGGDSYPINNVIGGVGPEFSNIISGNHDSGIEIIRGVSNVVASNYIGLNVNGDKELHNGNPEVNDRAAGIFILEGSNNVIGGADSNSRNVISGNLGAGIEINAGWVADDPDLGAFQKHAFGNSIRSNYIGTNGAGLAAVPNGLAGILVSSKNSNTFRVEKSFIGDAVDGGNVISGNNGPGIQIDGANTIGSIVHKNIIGLASDGITPLGNETHGVLIRSGSSENIIGSTATEDLGNTIAFNGGGRLVSGVPSYNGNGPGLYGHGVFVEKGTKNTVRLNSIFNNEGRGVDLGDFDDDGSLSKVQSFTLNDVLENKSGVFFDQDDGGNDLQNYPIVINVSFTPSGKTISWMLHSRPGDYIIDFYANDMPDPSGFGEGKRYLGSETVSVVNTSDANLLFLGERGVITRTFSLTDKNVSATATDTAGNTSEFSMVDTDGDALADVWELSESIDINEDGIGDYVLPFEADPNQKNIFIEIDSMKGMGLLEANSNSLKAKFGGVPQELIHNPNGQAGIILTIDNDETDIPRYHWSSDIGRDDLDWPVEFDAYKNRILHRYAGGGSSVGYFGAANERSDDNWKHIRAAKLLVYHYAFMAWKVGSDDDPSAGAADLGNGLGGNDLWVANGLFENRWDFNLLKVGGLMHEMGHNLGLGHGGARAIEVEPGVSAGSGIADHINYKPNYNSIMNYMWQNPLPWMREDVNQDTELNELFERDFDNDGKASLDSIWSLNFSSRAYNKLDESALNETVGIGGDSKKWVLIGPPQLTLPALGIDPRMPETGPVDYNHDGDETDTAAKEALINYINIDSTEPVNQNFETLEGRVDWSILRYHFLSSPEFGNARLPQPEPELSLDDLLRLESIGVGYGFVRFDKSRYPVNEASAGALVTVTRGGGTYGAITIDYSIAPITADAGVDYVSVNGTITFSEGEYLKTFNVPILSDDIDEDVEIARLVLSNPTGGVVLLSGQEVSELQIEDNNGPGNFAFSTPYVDVNETAGVVTIELTRTAGVDGEATVDYFTIDDTATGGQDYVVTSGTLNFAPGQTTASFTVTILPDLETEITERLLLELANPTGGSALGDFPVVSVNIIDAPVTAGVLQFSNSSYDVVENSANATITVERTGTTNGAVSVDYAVSDGSATAGEDYSPVSGTLDFIDGQDSETFNVPILDDAFNEGNETLVLTLSNATGGAGIRAPPQANLNIIDDEGAGTLQFSSATYSVSEGSGTATIEVVRVGSSNGVVSVDYATADDTAVTGSDYTSTRDTLTFTDGQISDTFSVAITDDNDGELTESLQLSLGNLTGSAQLGVPSTAILAITDNEQPFVVTNVNDTGGGSLRAAITAANERPGADIITFNIPGDGVHTISVGEIVQANYPAFTGQVIIDGYSQPGARPNTSTTGSNAILKIELEGSHLPDRTPDGRTLLISYGLKLATNNSLIRGLAINRFKNFGIDVTHGTSGNRVTGNFIGTDSTGFRTFLDLDQFITISPPVTYNTPAPGQDSFGSQYRGVRIGVSANGNFVGGSRPEDRNILSGLHAGVGISVGYNNQVQGNLIGVAADGSSPLPNLVGILEAYHNRNVPDEANLDTTIIGGIQPGEGNVIAHNWHYGVENRPTRNLNGVTHSAIRGNSFFNNGPLPRHFDILYASERAGVANLRQRYGYAVIFTDDAKDDLTLHGPENDPLDADGIPNRPVLNSVMTSAGNTVIKGVLDSEPDREFSIDFYASRDIDPMGYGEGEIYLGSAQVTTGVEGHADFTFNLNQQLSPGLAITATATRRYTSMFSARIMVGDILASPFVVNTTEDTDDGVCDVTHCSLREAILGANNHPGEDQIHFAIESGPQTIALSMAKELPPVTEPVVIDGTTQPGFAGSPIIEMTGEDGDDHTEPPRFGLRLYGGNSTIRGLVINGMQFGVMAPFGLGISTGNLAEPYFSFPGGYRFEGNYIGTSLAGDVAVPNGGGLKLQAPDNVVGGTNLEQRNVISGNGSGIDLYPYPSRSNFPSGGGSQILGNYIGTDATGNHAVGNTGNAISASGGVWGHIGHVIGGSVQGAGNVISGNRGAITFLSGTGHVIQGNFIGTNADGTKALGNVSGISFGYMSNNTGVYGESLIGGAEVLARNVISGNFGAGISIDFRNSNKLQISGNYIGTDVSGTVRLSETGTTGIALGGGGHTIGGTEPGMGNLISGDYIGINLGGNNHQIEGNRIGTTADGSGAIGDGQTGDFDDGYGIYCSTRELPTDVIIGGTEPGSGNIIANYTGNGVGCTAGSRITILGNSIHSNLQHGIALRRYYDQVPANDPGDADEGPNNLQNYPDITAASLSAGTISVSGSLNSMPETIYRLEFFSNTVVDDTETDPGYGEGEHFLGAVAVTTDSNGDVLFSETFPSRPGQFISATATDPDGNTSEFASTVTISGATNLSPVVQDDDAVTAQATPVTIYILANDEDPDGDLDPATAAVTSGPSNGTTEVNPITGAVTYTPANLFSGGDSFQYTVRDTLGAVSNVATVSVTVLPPSNLPPVANAGADTSGFVGDSIQLDGSASSDPDEDPLTYSWLLTQRPEGGTVELSNPTSVTPILVPDKRGDYTAQLIVNDSEEDSAPDTVLIEVLNTPPVADAGSDQTVLVGDMPALDGSGSSDADSDPLSYLWTLTSKPVGSTASLSNTTAVNPTLSIDIKGTYTVQLVVNDGFTDSAADTVTLSTGNTPPVADAGPDQDGLVDDMIILDGSGSSDADGDVLTYSWLLLSSPPGSTATLSDPSVVSPTITVDLKGEYVVELTVNDGTEDSLGDTMMISIENTAPLADAGADQLVGPGDTATLDGSGSTDADGDALTYSWTITGKPAGSIATLSDLTAVMPTLLVDELGTYTIELVVNDSVTDSLPDEVDLRSINVAPVADAGSDQSVLVGQRVQLDGSSSSDADGDALTYSWSIIDSPVGSIALLSDASSVMPTLDLDVFGSYTIKLVVNDGIEDSEPDTVLLNAINTLPVADAGSDQSVFVGETVVLDGSGSNDADGNPLTFSWSLIKKPDASLAVLMDEMTVSPLIVIDEQGIYIIQLIVNDGIEDSLPDTVLLNVGNVRPIADAGPDQAVTVPTTVSLDGSGSSDADNDPLTYNWSILNAPSGNASVIPDPGIVDPTLDIELEGNYILQLIVNDGTVDSNADSVIVNATQSTQDADGDGVLDDYDICENTVIPEIVVPSKKLGIDRWALIDDDHIFDTRLPKGVGPEKYFTTEDTHGCSCEQIIERLQLGTGQIKFGCSISAMEDWVAGILIKEQ